MSSSKSESRQKNREKIPGLLKEYSRCPISGVLALTTRLIKRHENMRHTPHPMLIPLCSIVPGHGISDDQFEKTQERSKEAIRHMDRLLELRTMEVSKAREAFSKLLPSDEDVELCLIPEGDTLTIAGHRVTIDGTFFFCYAGTGRITALLLATPPALRTQLHVPVTVFWFHSHPNAGRAIYTRRVQSESKHHSNMYLRALAGPTEEEWEAAGAPVPFPKNNNNSAPPSARQPWDATTPNRGIPSNREAPPLPSPATIARSRSHPQVLDTVLWEPTYGCYPQTSGIVSIEKVYKNVAL